MSREPVKVDLFGLQLLVRPTDEGFHARVVYRAAGLTASLSSLVELDEQALRTLLDGIGRQYADFGQPVDWHSPDGSVHVGWTLDALGHARGSVELRDGGRWSLRATLTGDQSWLPAMALGLRLLLRG